MREASNKTEVVIQQTDDFQLLSISLLREYLEIEFKMDNLPFPYNLERIIGKHTMLLLQNLHSQV